MAKLSPCHKVKGFTLIEVLVALAILAIALSAVMRVVTQAVDMTAALRDRAIAAGVAQDQLALHQLHHDWPDTDTTDGVREQGGREWRWQEKVISTSVASFRRIEIDVRDTKDKEVLAHLVGFLQAPS